MLERQAVRRLISRARFIDDSSSTSSRTMMPSTTSSSTSVNPLRRGRGTRRNRTDKERNFARLPCLIVDPSHANLLRHTTRIYPGKPHIELIVVNLIGAHPFSLLRPPSRQRPH